MHSHETKPVFFNQPQSKQSESVFFSHARHRLIMQLQTQMNNVVKMWPVPAVSDKKPKGNSYGCKLLLSQHLANKFLKNVFGILKVTYWKTKQEKLSSDLIVCKLDHCYILLSSLPKKTQKLWTSFKNLLQNQERWVHPFCSQLQLIDFKFLQLVFTSNASWKQIRLICLWHTNPAVLRELQNEWTTLHTFNWISEP